MHAVHNCSKVEKSSSIYELDSMNDGTDMSVLSDTRSTLE